MANQLDPCGCQQQTTQTECGTFDINPPHPDLGQCSPHSVKKTCDAPSVSIDPSESVTISYDANGNPVYTLSSVSPVIPTPGPNPIYYVEVDEVRMLNSTPASPAGKIWTPDGLTLYFGTTPIGGAAPIFSSVTISGSLNIPGITNALLYANGSGLITPLGIGSNLSISGGVLNASGGGGGGGLTSWGLIGGTLSNQVDLMTALSLRALNTITVNGHQLTSNVTVTPSDIGLGNVLNVAQEPAITGGTVNQYWRGDKSWQTLNATAVGLGNVLNSVQLVAANNLSDLANQATARTNLGLGNVENTALSTYVWPYQTLKTKDSDNSNSATIYWAENDSSNRTLGLILGGGNRTVSIAGNATINDWFDQNVKSSASPQFVALGIGQAADTPGYALAVTGSSYFRNNLTVGAGSAGTDKLWVFDPGLLGATCSIAVQAGSSLTRWAADPVTSWIGVATNSPFALRTNNTERLRILGNGFVGINYSAPGYALDVAGDININGSGNIHYKINGTNLAKGDVGLSNVENTALSTWAGTTNITNLGTIGTGVWHGTAIADSYIASAATWNAKEPAITAGTTLQYWRGDKTWQTLPTIPAHLPINVMDYGAVGDGSHDDTTNIANAIAACPATHAALYFPSGIYKTSHIVLTSKTDWLVYGDGIGASIIKASSPSKVFSVVSGDHVTVYGLTFDGSCTTRTAGQQAFNLSGSYCSASHIEILNSGEFSCSCGYDSATDHISLDHVNVHGGFADGINLNTVNTAMVSNCTVDASDDDLLALGVCNDVIVNGFYGKARTDLGTSWGRGIAIFGGYDILLSNIFIDTTKQTGIWLNNESGSGIPTRVTFNNVKLVNAARISGNGIDVKQSTDCVMNKVVIENPGNNGVFAPDCVSLECFTNLVIKDCTFGTNFNQYCRGIHAAEGSSGFTPRAGLTIKDCTVNMLAAGNYQSYYFVCGDSVTHTWAAPITDLVIDDCIANQTPFGAYIQIDYMAGTPKFKNNTVMKSTSYVQIGNGWVTSHAYAVNECVTDPGSSLPYRCAIAHTSGTFATDLAAGKWVLIRTLGND